MKYLSVCSGIEAATVAWHPLGWEPVAFSEIEKFPNAVLKQRYPEVPNLGDMTKHKEWDRERFKNLDILVGGTPCQSFSLAGLRKGMDDPRGNLSLVFLGIVDRYKPTWVVWENVPGVLSSNDGRDFGTFLRALAELGYGWSYRSLDAQYVRVESYSRAVPQRRRRVFVVGYLGNWSRAGAVLLERGSLSGHSPPRRAAGKGVAKDAASSPAGSGRAVERIEESREHGPVIATAHETGHGFWTNDEIAGLRAASGGRDENLIIHAQRDEGFDISEDEAGRETQIVSEVAPSMTASGPPYSRTGNSRVESEALVVFDTTQITSVTNRSNPKPDDPCHTLATGAHSPAIAFGWNKSAAQSLRVDDTTDALQASPTSNPAVLKNMVVRRLTPLECERLQGFPDGYTRIKWRGKDSEDCPDGHRYQALGNSMAVNVMSWIGQRIAIVDALNQEQNDG